MSHDDTSERDRLMQVLRERVKRVPPAVLQGGTQQVQAYKVAVTKAQRLLAAKRMPALAQLQAAVGGLNPYF